MAEIVRTPTKATGGITPEEKRRLDEHAQLWIARAMRTQPIDPAQIVPAIKGLYRAANLKEPRVVIVPSPLVMAFAYGASAAIWHGRKGKKRPTRAATYDATCAATYDATRAATYDATRAATYDATRDATCAATYDATRAATDDATRVATRAATDDATRVATRAATDDATYDATCAATYDATRDATRAATYDATYDATCAATYDATDAATRVAERLAALACHSLAGEFGLKCAGRWSDIYQGGNMWAYYDCYLSAFRDVLGLRLPQHGKYVFWEMAAIHGGFRVMHEEFCLVSDFPEIIKVDAENRPHCETGPSHRWRDGWSLYHWHGVKIPGEWIEDRSSLTAKTALTWRNVEQRRAACEILGWVHVLRELNARTIERDDDPQIGELVEVTIEGSRERFLRVTCGTGREFALPVPPDMQTALQANSWTFGFDDVRQFVKPEVRT